MRRRANLTLISIILPISLTLVGVKLFGMTQLSASRAATGSSLMNAAGATRVNPVMPAMMTPNGCETPSFSAAASVSGGGLSVAVGDFNKDGNLDLATAHDFQNKVFVRLGDGMGGFIDAPDISVAMGPVDVVVGDFDEDGNLDLATASRGENNVVSILLGNGMGGFIAGQTISTAFPFVLAVGDFNEDDNLDLAVGNNTAGNVSILLGDGMGGFTAAPIPIGVVGSPATVAVGDFNADDHLDLAVGGAGTQIVSILLGDGMGGFNAAPNVNVGGNPLSVAVGDFNGDDKSDLVVAKNTTSDVSILLGDGMGGFNAAASPVAGLAPFSVAVGDFNADDNLDLVVANGGSNDASILLGDGMGGFSAGPTVALGNTPFSVAVGDFNNNGGLDFATANRGNIISNVSIQLNSCVTNNPPTISAVAVTRTAGAGGSNSQIATVSDLQDDENALTVKVNGLASATVSGVTVSNITVDAMGVVKADVAAACAATNANFTLKVTDSVGASATATLSVTVTPETKKPVINCPDDVVVYLPPNSMDTGMVVNYAAPTAMDNCTASPAITTSKASGSIFPVGATTVTATATDDAGNQSSCNFTVTVLYSFSGFFQPVENAPTVNAVNAGRSIPIKFSLSGNKGLNIFAAGYPVSQEIACFGGATLSPIEDTVTAGASSLSYDATADQYIYVWKTERAWKGTCRKLIVRLKDGSERVAYFQFK